MGWWIAFVSDVNSQHHSILICGAEPQPKSAARKAVETRQAKKEKRQQAIEKAKATKEAKKRVTIVDPKDSESNDELQLTEDTEDENGKDSSSDSDLTDLLDLGQLDVQALRELIKHSTRRPLIITLYAHQQLDHEIDHLVIRRESRYQELEMHPRRPLTVAYLNRDVIIRRGDLGL